MEDLKVLQNLDLSHNQISSLQGLEHHNLLEEINLEDNKVMYFTAFGLMVYIKVGISEGQHRYPTNGFTRVST